MDRFPFSCYFNGADSLLWPESEERSQSSLSFIGDSQFPLSLPVCHDSQDAGVRCVRADRRSECFNSSETAGSLDMERWNLAEGEVKSQSNGSRSRLAYTVQCPPPSLDTQEFEIRYLRSENLFPGKGLHSSEESSLHEMACWDLADGEVISQDAVLPLGDAETPPCPPASLHSQEFIRRCKEQDGIMLMNSEETLERSQVNSLEACDLMDCETRQRSPPKVFTGESKSRILPSPVDVQDADVNYSTRKDLLSENSLQDLAPGEEKSQRSLCKFYCDSETQERLECSLASPEFASLWEEEENGSTGNPVSSTEVALDESSSLSPHLRSSRTQSQRIAAYIQNCPDVEDNEIFSEDNVTENSSVSAYSEQSGYDVRPTLSSARSLSLQIKCSTAMPNEVSTNKPAPSLAVPLTTQTADSVRNIKDHRSKRKNQGPPLSSEDEVLATKKLPFRDQTSDWKRSPPVRRSPLKPLSVNQRLINDVKDDEVCNAKRPYQGNALLSKGADIENRAHLAVPELFLSSQYYSTGKAAVEFQTIPEDLDDKCRSSSDPKMNLQSSKQVRVHDVQPESTVRLDTYTLNKSSRCSLQTQLSSRVGISSEQTQGWLCPRASKRLLSKKPTQRLLDTWLK